MKRQKEFRKEFVFGQVDISKFEHFFALDWSQNGGALAYMHSSSPHPKVVDLPADITEISHYVERFKGRKILTIEETTSTHWLYVNLKEDFDYILVCDPYHNSLLNDGPKTDRLDAAKLCMLLRSNMLKEVYHNCDSLYWVRRFVKAYLSLKKGRTGAFNRKSALYRGVGTRYRKERFSSAHPALLFINDYFESTISFYEGWREKFVNEFKRLYKQEPVIQYLAMIPGIGVVTAVIVYAIVLSADRFKNKYKFFGYSGLALKEKESGNRSYGKRKGRYNRTLKWIFKSAAMSAISGHNDIRHYYDCLLSLGYPIKVARNAVARYIANSCYVIMKHQFAYQPYSWKNQKQFKSMVGNET